MSLAAIGQTSAVAEPCPQPPTQSTPSQTAPNGQDMDLMVTEEVVTVDDIPYEGTDDRQSSTLGTIKKSKILVTLSDDLSYTLAIDGDSLSAVMDSISTDKDMKSEWNSWQRFCQNPNQFFVYIFDEDFKEYVRYRQDVPIRHLTRLKIKNKIYVNQTGLKSCYQQLIGSQSPVIDDGFDTEPTDALVNDQPNPPSMAAPVSSPSEPTLATHQPKTQNTAINDIISHVSDIPILLTPDHLFNV